MILSFSDVTELKKAVAEKFSLHLHFHDGCGGQYFTFDEPTQALKEYITEYFSARGLKVIFSENGDSFSVEEIS